jgi:polysaccharide biosynthesis/export protein
MKGSIMRFRGLLAALVIAIVAPAALAQTPAQMEMFRQLPPDQQAQLMQQYRQQGGQMQVIAAPSRAETSENNGEPDREREQRKPVIDRATGLPMFGYDLFAGAPSTFAPVVDVPVPVDYILGPGDMLHVQLLGKLPGVHVLAVNRDGAINFPDLGPITVAGLGFDETRRMLQERVSQQMIGVTASITMGELRSIRIFVLGEAERPGSYTVSSLSTITNALFASGGVKPIGSLRNIQLKRNGELVTTLDLYDLLLRGDTRADARLSPGDVIFIPHVGTQVGIRGEVRRPALYELKGESTAGDMLALGGGLSSEAFPQRASLARINERQERVLEDLDLRNADGRGRRVRTGDVITVPSVLDRVDNVVRLEGHVWREGSVEFRPGMRLTDLIPSLDDVRPMPDQHYVLIRRELPPDRRVIGLSANLAEAWNDRGGPADLPLMARDQVRVFGLSNERPDVAALLSELRLQASFDEAAPVVRIGGRVRAPGEYPLEPGMRVSDLLRAGGQLSESAYVIAAEVTRYEVINGDFREIALVNVDLAAIRAGDTSADLALQPYDFLNVREVTDWRDQETVTLRGEVRFPGTYPIRKGETLLSVLGRAGGLTDRAYPNGAIFTRVQLREREAQQLRQLSERMEADLAALALQESQAGGDQGTVEAIAAGRSLLSDLSNAKPVGRLAMDFPKVLTASPGSDGDIILEDGDLLMVPGPKQSVTVIGEVQSPTSILFDRALGRDDYINLSGGMTRRADAANVYIVRANGQVTANGNRKWFRTADARLQPGDTIVVPTDVERMRPLPLWSAVTSIIFNLAVAVAAVNSF